jgi:DNA polymerase-1
MRREVVTRETFHEVLETLSQQTHLAVDTETTGLWPYKSDVLFSIIIAGEPGTFYFNMEAYEDVGDNFVLNESVYWDALRRLFLDPFKIWFLQNAKFDLAFLAKEGVEIAGKKHDTKTTARLLWNDYQSYSLKDLAKRHLGEEKSDAVERYVAENKLFESVEVPHKNVKERKVFYHCVPFEIISQYGLQDGHITYKLGRWQIEQVIQESSVARKKHRPLSQVYELECRLIRPMFEMERLGVRVDSEYCKNAIAYEESQASTAAHNFFKLTGRTFMDSNKLFSEVFDGVQVPTTAKGNPSFDKDSLRAIIDNPIAQTILAYREAKAQANFFHGFLHHSRNGEIHTSFLADGTASGRFSSSNPNLQNLTKPDSTGGGQGGYEVRGAIVPRPGFIFAIFDYQAQEYRLLLDRAGAHSLIEKVKTGLDVHQATADVAGVTRQQAKSANFATLYGSGNAKLAETLKTDVNTAKRVKDSIFKAAPEIKKFIQNTISEAEDFKKVVNWFGRISRFPDIKFCYRAPNYVIQGGCADITKIAICNVHDYLTDKKSRMVLTVHDSIIVEVHESERFVIPEIKKIMEQAYPHISLPMKVTIEWSDKNLAETRDYEGLEERV